MNGPEAPDIKRFLSGPVDRRKFDEYLLSPTHPDGKNKLRLWRSAFGIGEGEGDLLWQLIREQLPQATVAETERKTAREDPSRVFRKWELVIARFVGPNRSEERVITVWALEPGEDKPHFVTAYPDI